MICNITSNAVFLAPEPIIYTFGSSADESDEETILNQLTLGFKTKFLQSFRFKLDKKSFIELLPDQIKIIGSLAETKSLESTDDKAKLPRPGMPGESTTRSDNSRWIIECQNLRAGNPDSDMRFSRTIRLGLRVSDNPSVRRTLCTGIPYPDKRHLERSYSSQLNLNTKAPLPTMK